MEWFKNKTFKNVETNIQYTNSVFQIILLSEKKQDIDIKYIYDKVFGCLYIIEKKQFCSANLK